MEQGVVEHVRREHVHHGREDALQRLLVLLRRRLAPGDEGAVEEVAGADGAVREAHELVGHLHLAVDEGQVLHGEAAQAWPDEVFHVLAVDVLRPAGTQHLHGGVGVASLAHPEPAIAGVGVRLHVLVFLAVGARGVDLLQGVGGEEGCA